MKNVILIKETFFRSATTHYQKCLTGELRLVPSDEQLKELHQDYREMVSAQMFYETPVGFDNIIDRLGALESQINKLQKIF